MKKQIVEEEETRKREQDGNIRNDENGQNSTKKESCYTENVVNDIFSPMMFSSDDTSSGTKPKVFLCF